MVLFLFVFFFKQKTAYEMRISDWSSDVCSSDLYRDSPARPETVGLLDDEWRVAYNRISASLDEQIAVADKKHSSSAWTGRRTIKEQVIIVRELAPVALRELDELASLIESKRFNDQITADAVQCLRELHRQLGELLTAVDDGKLTREAVEAIERNNQKLVHYVHGGAKLQVVAPALPLRTETGRVGKEGVSTGN